MPRPRWVALAVAILAIGAGGVAVAARALPEKGASPPEPVHLGGADLVAGPEGEVRHRPTRGAHLDSLDLGGSHYNDLRAYDIRAGSDGTLYLLTGWADCDAMERCYGFVTRFVDDLVADSSTSYADAYPGQLAVAPDRLAARISSGPRVYDFVPGHEQDDLDEIPFQPLSGGYTAEGTLVASKVNAPEIVAVRPDGTVEHLLAPTGSPEPAPARLDSDAAALTVVALPDGRIAFATNAPDDPDLDGRVYLLDGETLQPLDLPEGTHPIRRIFPGPDGTLLALEGPHITQVDPATATTNRLIDLSEVADELAPASDAWPPIQDISATAYGNDLLFTAKYQVWRLPDAFE